VTAVAATIKGITIQIGSDTTGLATALSDINKLARDIQSELRQVEKLLKFNPHDTELLAQKQQLLADQVENTRKKLDTLKIAQEQVNEQFRKGEISQEQYRAFQRELVKTEDQLRSYEGQLKQVNLQNSEFAAKSAEIGQKLEGLGKKLTDVGKKWSMNVTAPLTALGFAAGKSAIDFESAFAGVRKTVDASEEEFATLEQGIRDMAKEIPAAATEIAGVAEAAGQLGIAVPHILSFTRTMTDLGVATNLTAEEAATNLARFANIVQMPQDQFDRLGATVVALGNNLATTEAEIVEMGLRLAGAGAQVGLAEAEIMALSGALSSVGIRAEAGGSAFSKLMMQMQLASEIGPRANEIIAQTGRSLRDLEILSNEDAKAFKEVAASIGLTGTELKDYVTAARDLEQFAAVTGQSAEEFSEAFKEDAVATIGSFIEGLATAEERGVSAIAVLEEMGITEIRLRDSLLRAAGAQEVFANAVVIGTEAWNENIALTKEAEQRYATTESQLQMMKNSLTDVAITFGEILLPAITSVVKEIGKFADWLGSLNPETQRTIVIVAALAAAIGPVALIIGKVTSAVGVLLPFLATLGGFVMKTLIPAIAGISAPALATIGAIVGLAAVAYEVYRAWDEVKAALVATWELLKANVTQLGLYISIAFEEMKSVVLNAVNAMIEKLGILEKLPFGLGDKFKGLRDSIAESADASEARVAELQQALEENSKRIQVALEGTKVAFGDLGTKVADDVKGVISAITGQTAAIEQAQAQQTAIIADQSALRTDILNDEINRQIQAMYDGMTATVDSWIQAGYDSEGDVREMAETLAQGMADYLVGQSPPPKGPLSDIDEGGRRVVEAWTEGIIQGIPEVEFAAHTVATVTERALDQADRLRDKWMKAAQSIGEAFEKMAVAMGEMWLTGTGSWEEILLQFVRTAINHILTAAVAAMGIAELVSQAIANMWNPLGWIVIGGLLIALAAVQNELQQKLGGIGGVATPPSGGTGGGAAPSRPSGSGRQVSEITGPTRDILTDLMAPLANLNAIVAPIQDIRSILDARLPNFNTMQFAAVGAGGGNIVFEAGAIVIHSTATGGYELGNEMMDAIESRLAERLGGGRRGRGA